VTDTGRYGDPDFDVIRERFYGMVARHLSDCEPTPSQPRKSKKKRGKEKAASKLVVIDGRPVEIETYGDGVKDTKKNSTADALQWLIDNGHLKSPVPHGVSLNERDRLLEIAYAESNARITTATDLGRFFEKAELTPLRSPDFEATPGGGFGSRYVGVTKLRCMGIIQDVGRDIPPHCMAILEAVICRNEFPWLGKPKQEGQRILQMIRMALDFAAWCFDRAIDGPDRRIVDCKATVQIMRRWPEARDWITAKKLAGATHSFKMDRAPG
jgi:hypothetical protein